MFYDGVFLCFVVQTDGTALFVTRGYRDESVGQPVGRSVGRSGDRAIGPSGERAGARVIN